MSVNRGSDQLTSKALRAEAAAWVAKLHGPERSPDLEDDFRAWLGANPKHAKAFEHITEIWDALGNVNIGGLPRLAPSEAFEPTPCATRSRPYALRALAATLLLVVVAVGTWLYVARDAREVYLTDIGEQRIVTLEDGSRVYLNSDTRLDVGFEKRTRDIQLQRGEAYFQVAKDAARPFIVTAGDHTVTAFGTSFAVRYDPDLTAVTLVDGKVAVEGPSAANEDTQHVPTSSSQVTGKGQHTRVLLTPGQRITFEASGTATIDVPRPDTTAAWRRGEVIFDNTPLKDAIEQMSRYQRQRLILDDPGVGELPISGIYQTGKIQDFAQAVAAVYQVEVVTDGSEIHLRRKH